MPIALSSQLEAQFPLGVLQYYSGLARTMGAADVRPSQMGKETLVERSALGVVAAIIPWNFPVTLALNKIAPAMAAGCTLVIKPSPGRSDERRVGEEFVRTCQSWWWAFHSKHKVK